MFQNMQPLLFDGFPQKPSSVCLSSLRPCEVVANASEVDPQTVALLARACGAVAPAKQEQSEHAETVDGGCFLVFFQV